MLVRCLLLATVFDFNLERGLSPTNQKSKIMNSAWKTEMQTSVLLKQKQLKVHSTRALRPALKEEVELVKTFPKAIGAL